MEHGQKSRSFKIIIVISAIVGGALGFFSGMKFSDNKDNIYGYFDKTYSNFFSGDDEKDNIKLNEKTKSNDNKIYDGPLDAIVTQKYGILYGTFDKPCRVYGFESFDENEKFLGVLECSNIDPFDIDMAVNLKLDYRVLCKKREHVEDGELIHSKKFWAYSIKKYEEIQDEKIASAGEKDIY